jgi:hypothetical protein
LQPENEIEIVDEPTSGITPSAHVLTAAGPTSAKNTITVVTAQDVKSFQEMLKESLAIDMTR